MGPRGAIERRTWGHYAGSIVGYLGWILGLVVVCAMTGSFRVLVEVVPTAVLLSLGMAFMTVQSLELAQRFHPGNRRLLLRALWAKLTLDLGLLLLVAKAWVLPVLAREPDAWKLMEQLGGATAVPSTAVVLLLSAGCLLSFLAARDALGVARPVDSALPPSA